MLAEHVVVVPDRRARVPRHGDPEMLVIALSVGLLLSLCRPAVLGARSLAILVMACAAVSC